MPVGNQPQDCIECAKLRAELEAKDKRIKAFEERLEVDPKHTVDGIQARDATIALLEKRIAELEEVSAEAINDSVKFHREKVLLQKRIADAPHDKDCHCLYEQDEFGREYEPEQPDLSRCDCWKKA